LLKKFILVKRSNIRFISLAIAFLFALPFGWGKLSGLSIWMSPFIMLNSVLALKSFILLNCIGFIILTASWFRKRFFCRYLCPMGCILDMMPSPDTQGKRISFKKFPYINKWLVIISLAGSVFGIPVCIYLDPLSIFNGFFTSFASISVFAILFTCAGFILLLLIQFFWPGMWCKRICPLGGLQLLVSELKGFLSREKATAEKTDIGRRYFIGAIAGSAASFAFRFIVKDERAGIIRPPASLTPADFYATCTRCGSCRKSCPTKIIRQDTHIGFGLLTPEVKFESGYCLESCNSCSVVCPSGAITLFNADAKSQIIMGKAEVKTADCLLYINKECDRCKAACYYKAILIQGKRDKSLMLPEIVSEKCVGCGACKVICPTNCITVS
jgi:ferredoxin-type protein NapF